jgi:uncharacterized Zn finger protein (UPF0148 family)
MRRIQPRRAVANRGGVMRYVVCPKCGDPVAGRLTKELTCVNCKENFPLVESEVHTGIVIYDQSTRRWKAG